MIGRLFCGSSAPRSTDLTLAGSLTSTPDEFCNG